MQDLTEYLNDVRELAAPRLTIHDNMVRATIVSVVFGPTSKYEDEYDRVRDAVKYLEGYAPHPVATTYYKGSEARPVPSRVVVFSDGLYPPEHADHIPFGRFLAFTIIHELAHAACTCSGIGEDDGHNNPAWVQGCKEMGIKEEAYDKKGPDWKGEFEFTDQDLWERIQELPSYPGDEWPDEARAA